MPSISYDGQIITESAIVTQFLADAFPSHLVPPSNTADGALRRARINFFVDAFSSKVSPNIFKIFRPQSDEDKEKIVDEVIAVIAKELEPLLADAAPYFGGSEKITLAEVFKSLKPLFAFWDGLCFTYPLPLPHFSFEIPLSCCSMATNTPSRRSSPDPSSSDSTPFPIRASSPSAWRPNSRRRHPTSPSGHRLSLIPQV